MADSGWEEGEEGEEEEVVEEEEEVVLRTRPSPPPLLGSSSTKAHLTTFPPITPAEDDAREEGQQRGHLLHTQDATDAMDPGITDKLTNNLSFSVEGSNGVTSAKIDQKLISWCSLFCQNLI